jgi:hypothetical protein
VSGQNARSDDAQQLVRTDADDPTSDVLATEVTRTFALIADDDTRRLVAIKEVTRINGTFLLLTPDASDALAALLTRRAAEARADEAAAQARLAESRSA